MLRNLKSFEYLPKYFVESGFYYLFNTLWYIFILYRKYIAKLGGFSSKQPCKYLLNSLYSSIGIQVSRYIDHCCLNF